jgi:hypothetical protein
MARQPLGGLGLLIFQGFTITLRHTTLGRTPLDEWSARRRDLYLTTHNIPCPRRDSNPQSQQAIGHSSAQYFNSRCTIVVLSAPCVPSRLCPSYFPTKRLYAFLFSPVGVIWTRIYTIFKCNSNCRSEYLLQVSTHDVSVLPRCDPPTEHILPLSGWQWSLNTLFVLTSALKAQSVTCLEGKFIKMNNAAKRAVCWMRQEGLNIETRHGDLFGHGKNDSWGYKGRPHVDGRLT